MLTTFSLRSDVPATLRRTAERSVLQAREPTNQEAPFRSLLVYLVKLSLHPDSSLSHKQEHVGNSGYNRFIQLIQLDDWTVYPHTYLLAK